jgi:trigger factor
MIRKSSKVLFSIFLAAALLTMTACGGAKIPKQYEYDDLSKYIKLGEYKGLEYHSSEITVTDEEVKEVVDEALTQATTTKDVEEGTVTGTSKLKIDYVGKIDGKEFDGGTATDQEIDIANSAYIDGFAEGLVGHNVGEKVVLNLTFPEDYGNDKVAGKAAEFTVTIKALQVDEVPEYNDEFVKKNTDYKNIAEYEKSIREDLTKSKEESAKASQRSEVFSQIVSSSEIKEYPEKELNARIEQNKKAYEEYAEQYGMKYEEFIESSMGVSADDFNAQLEADAQNTVRNELVLYALAKEYGVEISASDYDDYLMDLLKDAGFTKDSYEEEAGMSIYDYAEENNLFLGMLYEKVMDNVMKDCKEVKTEVTPESEAEAAAHNS